MTSKLKISNKKRRHGNSVTGIKERPKVFLSMPRRKDKAIKKILITMEGIQHKKRWYSWTQKPKMTPKKFASI